MSNTNQPELGLRSPAAGRPRAAYALAASIAVIGSNSLVLGPIAPEVAASLAVSVPAVMTAAGVFGLGTAASALFLARHIDRLGAWRVLTLALAVLGVALSACALAPTVAGLVAGQLVAGVATGVGLPAIYSLAAAIAPAGRESRTIGLVLTGWPISLVLGVSLSAVLADFLHWRAVYAMVAILVAVMAATLFFMRREPVPGPAPASAPLPTEALRIVGVKPLLVACGAFSVAFYGVYGYLGDHLHRDLGQPLTSNGIAALVYGLGFASAVLLDRVVDRLGARRIMPAAFLAVAAVYVAMAVVGDSFSGLLMAVFVWGLANHVGLNALIMRLTIIDPARRGTIMGLNSAVTYLSVFLGTTGFGPLYARFGFAAAASVAAGLMLFAVLLEIARAMAPRVDVMRDRAAQRG